jgi:hypothetical protein
VVFLPPPSQAKEGTAPDYAPTGTGRQLGGRMRRNPAKTTLADLQKQAGWVRAYCESIGCGHKAPLAIAPVVIRWGGDKSSDLMRERLRCSKCGRLGATLQVSTWVNNVTGTEPFPVDGC